LNYGLYFYVVAHSGEANIERGIVHLARAFQQSSHQGVLYFPADILMLAIRRSHFPDFTAQQFYPLCKLPKQVIGVRISAVRIKLVKRSDGHKQRNECFGCKDTDFQGRLLDDIFRADVTQIFLRNIRAK
jgi:hypothetical protein